MRFTLEPVRLALVPSGLNLEFWKLTLELQRLTHVHTHIRTVFHFT
jgi:hypothetical protein